MSAVRHILAVEDEESHIELIERAFGSHPDEYTITIVKSIAMARASLAKSEADLLLIDYRLPDGAGEEFMASLGGKYPVVMMTAYGDEALAVQSIKAGALDYVVKSPETFAILPHAVERALREWDLRTANRLAADTLRESEEQYRELIENIDDVIFSMTTDGIFTYVSSAVTRLTDYGTDELIGKSYLALVYPEDLPEVTSHLEALLFGKKRTDEYRISTKAGDIRWIQSVSRVTAQGDITGRYTDITSRRMLESQKDALMQADKMIALGTLVSGVAHEINNPNNFIMMNTPILRDVWQETLPILQEYYEAHGEFVLGGINYTTMKDEIPELLTGIQEGSDRIKDIVKDLKRFVRMEPPDLSETVDINEVVRGAITLLGSTIRAATHNFKTDYRENLPVIKGSFQRIEQVVINLIQNSCHALQDTAKGITIRTGYIEDADSVFIQIDDEGQGISPANLKHLANPFFTTKRDTGGTGLGLSISMGIIKDHGGALSFTSTVGKGTCAVVVLPVVKMVGG